jgi:hypothetical protein
MHLGARDFGSMGLWEHGTLGAWDFWRKDILEHGTLGAWDFGSKGLWETCAARAMNTGSQETRCFGNQCAPPADKCAPMAYNRTPQSSEVSQKQNEESPLSYFLAA